MVDCRLIRPDTKQLRAIDNPKSKIGNQPFARRHRELPYLDISPIFMMKKYIVFCS